MGGDATKPVFGVSEKARLKPVFSATEIDKIEISLVASLDMIISKRLVCAFVVRKPQRQVFSLRGPNDLLFCWFSLIGR